MRFFKEVGQLTEKDHILRMQSKLSKLSLKERQYIFPPQKISKEDFQNLGKTSKKFGQSQAYQYSDKTSNQLSGRNNQNLKICRDICIKKQGSNEQKKMDIIPKLKD